MEVIDGIRAFWPAGWRPELPTIGLLMAGFFGVGTVGFALIAGNELNQALNGMPAGVPATTGFVVQLPAWARVSSAAAFVGGVAIGVGAISGLALMARRSWGSSLAVAALLVAALALLVNLIDTATHVGAGGVIYPVVAVVGMIALVLILIGRLPKVHLPSPGIDGRSWMEDDPRSTDTATTP